jgi:hypothetical protein
VCLLKCFLLCVKCCPVNVHVTLLISVTRSASGQRRGSLGPKLPFTSVLQPMLPWPPIIPGCSVCCAPLSTRLRLFRPPRSLIVAFVILCVCRLSPPGRLLFIHTLLRKTSRPGGDAWPCAPHSHQPSWALPGHVLFSVAAPALLPCCGVPLLCVLSGRGSIPLHALSSQLNCAVPITMPPPRTAADYIVPEHRWRCVQHYLFSCKASLLGCPDPA